MNQDAHEQQAEESIAPHILKPKHRRVRSGRHRRRKLRIPAPLVFGLNAGLLGISSVLVYWRGKSFLAIAIIATLLTFLVLIVNERSGFSRSKRAPRSGEARTVFNDGDVVVLFGLLMLTFFVSLLAWMS